ncbi:hypothetical protein GCM10023322_26670 [Rugosimonospora acidiphila]|uniref:YtxH domain-containing protein n=1 Tax=Rugosimonospora acidiphila TaxID=556531 RepID=A0ABP9RR84_9ACTN
MRGKLVFLGGLAAGFVLGSRAGRQTYDSLARTARKVKDSPGMQEAAGVVQAQASKLYEQGKGMAADKISSTRFGDKLLHPNGDHLTVNGARASSSASAGSAGTSG